MKTKNLLIWAFACGVAILIAGTLMLKRVSDQTGVETAALNHSTTVGDMRVTVFGVRAAGGSTRPGLEVPVELAGATDDEPADDFRLLVDDTAFEVAESDCPAVNTAAVRCVLRFDVAPPTDGAALLSYRRGESTATWVLG